MAYKEKIRGSVIKYSNVLNYHAIFLLIIAKLFSV